MNKFLIVLFIFSLTPSVLGKIVHYELIGTRGKINLSGKKTVDFALMLNGQIPAPTLEFTEGDEAEIVLKNQIPGEELSVHWHGILLPPEMDGVPYVNTPPIHSGKQFTFRFKFASTAPIGITPTLMSRSKKEFMGPLLSIQKGDN